MSIQLLDKTRKINGLLRRARSSKVLFNDVCACLSEVLASNTVVISRKGKILGHSALSSDVDLLQARVGEFLEPDLNDRLLSVLSTKENVNLETLGIETTLSDPAAILAPVEMGGERLGTIFACREAGKYEIDDIILFEYGATVVGLQMMQSVNEENEEALRKQRDVRSAISTLSYSEAAAVNCIFRELKGTEGIIVASKVADRVGITRSVIVNALKKFESAGVIESRSSGMKGTYIKVLNELVFEELDIS